MSAADVPMKKQGAVWTKSIKGLKFIKTNSNLFDYRILCCTRRTALYVASA